MEIECVSILNNIDFRSEYQIDSKKYYNKNLFQSAWSNTMISSYI